jgi:hypothetical protein
MSMIIHMLNNSYDRLLEEIKTFCGRAGVTYICTCSDCFYFKRDDGLFSKPYHVALNGDLVMGDERYEGPFRSMRAADVKGFYNDMAARIVRGEVGLASKMAAHKISTSDVLKDFDEKYKRVIPSPSASLWYLRCRELIPSAQGSAYLSLLGDMPEGVQIVGLRTSEQWVGQAVQVLEFLQSKMQRASLSKDVNLQVISKDLLADVRNTLELLQRLGGLQPSGQVARQARDRCADFVEAACLCAACLISQG